MLLYHVMTRSTSTAITSAMREKPQPDPEVLHPAQIHSVPDSTEADFGLVSTASHHDSTSTDPEKNFSSPTRVRRSCIPYADQLRPIHCPQLFPPQQPDLPLASATFPEGGRQAWLSVSGGFLVMVAGFGFINS